MPVVSGQLSPWAEWGVAGRALPGEAESADRHVVIERPDGALVAVIDGLGHGTLAVAAAKKAAETLEAHATASVEEALGHVHAALVGTRGAVASVAVIEKTKGELTWAGVGDVEGVLHAPGAKREALFLVPGVLGDRLARVRVQTTALAPGAVLVLATDGIRRAFVEEAPRLDLPEVLAERILNGHARGTDDALVLVVRYRGTP